MHNLLKTFFIGKAERDTFRALVHSRDGQSWARLKAITAPPLHFLCGGRGPCTWAIFCCFPGSIRRELGQHSQEFQLQLWYGMLV